MRKTNQKNNNTFKKTKVYFILVLFCFLFLLFPSIIPQENTYPVQVEVIENHAPSIELINPLDGQFDVPLNAELTVRVIDPENDTIDVFYYNEFNDEPIGYQKDVVSGNESSIIWDNLSYSTTYSWYVVANDSNYHNTSETWRFTTKNRPSEEPPSVSFSPVAVATVDKNVGVPGEVFTFDASESYALDDGIIVKYTWNFDDGTITSTDNTTITHMFTLVETYHVMLMVEDDKGETGSLNEPLTIEIVQASNPPENLIVTPETTWAHKNTTVTFTMNATDPDVNDTLRFEIDWDDGNTFVSEYVESGELFKTSHQWDTFGVYTVTVIAFDEHNASTAPVTTLMYVDVLVIDDINGWLIDTGSDGTFGLFKNLVTTEETLVEEQDDGSYLIDSTNDGKWNYAYNPDTGILIYSIYVYNKYLTIFYETPGFEFIPFIFVVSLFCVLYWRKKKIR